MILIGLFLDEESQDWLDEESQDWLDVESTCLDWLMTNLDLGRRWMMDMSEGDKQTKSFIQFSRAYPRHAMQALEIPFVTQAKVSGDYTPGGESWKIGITSILAYALRIAPFKGTFWTTPSQPGQVLPEGIEPYPALHALVSTMSTGPVGPGDKIGSTNVTLLNRCCSTGGMILKPNKPALALDRQIKERVFNGIVMELWATSTNYDAIDPGTLRFGTLFAVDTPDNFVYKEAEYMVFEYSNPHNLLKYNHTSGLQLPKCSKEDFCLYHFTPKFTAKNKEMYLLGEVNKWIPISPKRIATISVDGGHAILEMYGEVGEVVTISVLMDVFKYSSHCKINVVELMENNIRNVKEKYEYVVLPELAEIL
ncbi:hypothetical protein KUTeg_019488 [Tegillarca granosa]|uniref:Uncharacterized protein n=1 Tax=Tegillarca granosa TaxID=220873 RepID=A0ABQ9EGQ5_TEGGR|nr:hypothetical protein KUTeg_019488 [Tegillarca granosa]